MQNNQFAVDLDNVHSVLEIGQVCVIDLLGNLLCMYVSTCTEYQYSETFIK